MGRIFIALSLLISLSGCTSVTKEKLLSLKTGTKAEKVKEILGYPDDFLTSKNWGELDVKAIYLVKNDKCTVHLVNRRVEDVGCVR